jgi:hypothetical protein
MQLLSRKELELLMHNAGNPLISIYLPIHPTGNKEQDPIRLKNLLRDAEDQLIAYGLNAQQALDMLDPAYQLSIEPHAWRYHRGNSLAMFISPDTFQYYQLPYHVEDVVVIARRLHIKPLLPFFSEDSVFYILAISQNEVRLLQGTHYATHDITPDDIPVSLADALKYDEPEKQHQFHTTGPGGLAISHGHGVSKDRDKVNIFRYFRQVDQGLHRILEDSSAPLVVAAVEYLHAIYREANTYHHLLGTGIKGNPDGVGENVLRQQAWPIIQPYFQRSRVEHAERYQQAVSRGLATDDIKKATLAAHDGRIDTLFVTTDAQRWGQFDSEKRKVRLYNTNRPSTEDLLDLVAVNTLMKGGTVYAGGTEQIPSKASLAALFRY